MGAWVIASVFVLGLVSAQGRSLLDSQQDQEQEASAVVPSVQIQDSTGLAYTAKGLAVPATSLHSASPRQGQQQLASPTNTYQAFPVKRFHYTGTGGGFEPIVHPYQLHEDAESDQSGEAEQEDFEINHGQFLGNLDGFNQYKDSNSFQLVGPKQIETINTKSYHKEVQPYDVGEFQHDHAEHHGHHHEEEHAEVHYHQHKHVHKHHHKQEHHHKHKQEHKHHHGHKHEQKHHHKHEHHNEHKHHHGHKHDEHHHHKNEHKHHEDHKHDHHHGHKHEHKHHQDHKHDEHHGHKHDHHAEHDHKHHEEHKHDQHHDHHHHDEHKHKHDHHNQHKHHHGHEHKSHHHHGHKHEHKHGHKHHKHHHH